MMIADWVKTQPKHSLITNKLDLNQLKLLNIEAMMKCAQIHSIKSLAVRVVQIVQGQKSRVAEFVQWQESRVAEFGRAMKTAVYEIG
jgi:hypothetical protein